MDKMLKIAVVLTAYDQMTRVIKQATDDSTRKLKQLQATSREAFGKGLAMTGLGVALAAPLVNATNKAIAFEDQMADVAKVMNLEIGSGEFTKMGNKALDLAAKLRRPTEEAAGLMASLAQGGVIAADVERVGLIAGKMGVAFGMASDLAGEKFIKMKNALGITIDETEKVADAINFLSDNTAAKAEQIVTFMSSGGASVANTLKIAGQDIAAFGSVMISMGKSGEEAATIMSRFQKGVMGNDAMRKIFTDAGGGASGLMAILEKGSKLKGAKQFEFFQKFGQYGVSIKQMADNLDLTRETLGKVSDEQAFLNSVQAEFTNRTSTNAGKIQAFKTQMERISIIFGNQILPMVTKLIEKFGNLAERFANFAAAHPMVLKVAAAIIAVVSASSIAIGVFNILKGVVLAYKVIILTMTGALKGSVIVTKMITAAQWLWNAAMTANPIGIIIAAIAALTVGIIALVKNWKDIVNWVKTSDNWFAKLIRSSLKPIIWLFNKIKEAWQNIKAAFKGGGIMEGLKQIGKSILSFMLAPLEGILKLTNKLTNGKVGGDALKRIQDFRGSLEYTGGAGETAAQAQNIASAAVAADVPVTEENINAVQPVGAAMDLQAIGGGGASVGVNFNVNVTGDGNDIIQKLKAYEPELLRMIDEALARRSRKEY